MALPDHLSGLLVPGCYPHPCEAITLIETHISWVILTGQYAYKLKKPVRFNFVDFSTLERRLHFCAEEVRCNRAFAPSALSQNVVIFSQMQLLILQILFISIEECCLNWLCIGECK